MIRQKDKKVEKSKKEKQKKSGDYIMRKNTGAKILRVILWGLLLFISLRGVVSMLKPDQTAEVLEQVKAVDQDTQKRIMQNTELLSFAEEFMRNWGTFTSEEEFKNRLKHYVVPVVLEQAGIHDFTSTAAVTYVNAYRMEAYADGQYDVFVEVTSTNTRMVVKQEGTEEKQEPVVTGSDGVYKVPVQITEEEKYIVEGIPLVVYDQENLPATYQKEMIQLEKIENVTAYQETISNYLKAYYSDTTSVTDYYLAADADKASLYGFSEAGKFELISVNEVSAYRRAEGEILCLVGYQIRNVKTEEVILQQCNILLDDQEVERLYIKGMDTRMFNLKGGNELK